MENRNASSRLECYFLTNWCNWFSLVHLFSICTRFLISKNMGEYICICKVVGIYACRTQKRLVAYCQKQSGVILNLPGSHFLSLTLLFLPLLLIRAETRMSPKRTDATRKKSMSKFQGSSNTPGSKLNITFDFQSVHTDVWWGLLNQCTNYKRIFPGYFLQKIGRPGRENVYNAI